MIKNLLLSTKFKALVFSILCLVCGLTLNAQTWTIYDGSVLPDAATPAWAQGDKGTVYPSYSIVDDNGNSLLYEVSAASTDKLSYKLAGTQPASGTWIIRTKTGSTNPASIEFEFNASDGVNIYRCYFRLLNYAAGGYLKTNYLDANVTYPKDSTLTVNEFHTYRLTVENGKDFKIYLDENSTPIVTGTGTTTTNSQVLRIGDVGSNFTEGYIDWMAWDLTGAYAPGTTLPGGVIVDNTSLPVVPAAPNATAATATDQTSFTANWDASTNATSYFLDVATTSDFTTLVTGYSDKYVGNVTSYSVTGLTAGTQYYYRVRAYNMSGTSDNSSTIDVTTTSAVAAPAAPTATDATDITQTGFSANWGEAATATGYKLDVATDETFTNMVTGYSDQSVGNATTYAVTGLAENTMYYYRVRAYNDGGTSDNSNTISLTTLISAPTAPVATAATAVTSTSFSANWDAAATATGYKLDVATDAGFTSMVTGFSDKDVTNGTTYSVTGLTQNTAYYYRVRAYNDGGTSDNSNAINLTTLVTSVPSLAGVKVLIYPNPTVDEIKVENASIVQRYEIISLSGKVVSKAVNSGDVLEVNVSNLSKGVYILKVYSTEGTKQVKFVKK